MTDPSNFYPNSSHSNDADLPDSKNTTILTGDSATKGQASEASEEKQTIREPEDDSQGFFKGGIDAGDPPVNGNYESAMNYFFDRMEREARYSGHNGEVQKLSEAKQNLNEAFGELQVGQVAAKNIMILANEYAQTPRSDEALETMTTNVDRELTRKYGERKEEVIQAARRVLSGVEKRVPVVKDYVDAGLGSDLRFINHLVGIARQRGYLK